MTLHCGHCARAGKPDNHLYTDHCPECWSLHCRTPVECQRKITEGFDLLIEHLQKRKDNDHE